MKQHISFVDKHTDETLYTLDTVIVWKRHLFRLVPFVQLRKKCFIKLYEATNNSFIAYI